MSAETEELERLTANRDRLEGEQDRLMQAHYAGGVIALKQHSCSAGV